MSLGLEIEYLTGVAFAADGPDTGTPDWPPQPDRVFSALVAAWGAHGCPAAERLALEWIERQAVPEIAAAPAHPRQAATVFVPPNDPETGRGGDRAVLPVYRRRHARCFPAARPENPVVQLHWEGARPDAPTLAALDALARDVAYVGHSASLTRCRFLFPAPTPADAAPARRRVYPGRLAELEARFRGGRRPRPGDPVAPPVATPTTPRPASVFGDEWFILEDAGAGTGRMPDIRACALVCAALRDTLVAAYPAAGAGAAPEVVSGRAPDGRPSTHPHLAVAPLPFAGAPHADGRILGFALIAPRAGGLFGDPAFTAVLRYLSVWDTRRGRRLRLTLPLGGGVPLELTLTREPARASLDPAPYVRPAKTFATVTPLALDRHPHGDDAGAAAAQVATACARTGLPPPAVTLSPYSAVEGVPGARRSRSAPPWSDWRLPPWLAGRPLTHALLRFPQPVAGPVLLGAGRHVGLGLCRAIEGWERG